MTGWRKACLVAVAVVDVAAAVGLVLVAVADLATAAAAGSVVGAVAGVGAACLSVWALTGSAPMTVQADGGSNAAGGNMHNPRARHTGPPRTPPPTPAPAPAPAPRSGVSASGGSNAAGGDMNDPTAQHGP